MLGICFQLLLHFTNQYAARKVSTANALAKLSKYLIPLFFWCSLSVLHWVRVCICVSSTIGIHISISKIYL